MNFQPKLACWQVWNPFFEWSFQKKWIKQAFEEFTQITWQPFQKSFHHWLKSHMTVNGMRNTTSWTAVLSKVIFHYLSETLIIVRINTVFIENQSEREDLIDYLSLQRLHIKRMQRKHSNLQERSWWKVQNSMWSKSLSWWRILLLLFWHWERKDTVPRLRWKWALQ